MASTVTTELPPLQNADAVDFVGSRQASSGRRSSVGDDEDNQSEGTISDDVDQVEGSVAAAAKLQPPRAHGGGVEAGRPNRSFGVSQYHSISELSSPSATVSSATTAAAATFGVHPPSSSSFDFASQQQLYGRSAVDSVHVLRDMFQRQTNQSAGLPSCNGETAGNADASDADDEEDEWANDDVEHRTMSCDDDEYFGHSINVSMSSVDELSGDEEARQQNDSHTQPTGELNLSGNGIPLSGSDSGSAGDDVIEAKRARMESIVTNMRPFLQQLSGSDRTPANGTTDGEIVNLTSFKGEDPKRRPKRKQYIPKQHDTSSGVSSAVKQQMTDSSEETPTSFKDRKSLFSVAEKMALEAELRTVSDQLNYIRRKYSHLFDDSQQVNAAGYFTSKNTNDYTDVNGRPGKWRDSGWAFQSAFSKHASNEWKQLVPGADGGLSTLHSVSKQQSYGPAMQSSPLAGDTPVDIQQLAEMLRMEVTERVESLVNDIIRNFVAKYGLAHCSSLDTATESKFKPETEEKSSEGALRRADTVSSGSAPYAEDLSPDRDVDDAEHRPAALMTSSSASFLSVPNLLLPSPRHPTSTTTVQEETTPPGAEEARSLTDDDDAPERQTHSRSEVPLSASDQTAFEVSSHTAHHPAALYSLFAPHAYYPNASRMAAAAAAAAAVAANSAYPPVPPVASSMLFPRCREPEQTEALPLVVNAPTKKKRTKVTDTRLSPRAARSILHDAHRHHHTGSYHSHSHHHHQSQHFRPDSSHHHRVHHGGGAARITDDVTDLPANDRRRSSPTRTSADSATVVSPFIPSRHPSTVALPPLPLLPASLPTSVAVPNPSLQHSDIMSAIFQFSQQRIQQQQQQIDASQQQRFAPPPHAVFGAADKFDFKQLGTNDTQTSATDGLHASLPSARKAAAETNGADAYESLFHEDGLVSFTFSFSFINRPTLALGLG